LHKHPISGKRKNVHFGHFAGLTASLRVDDQFDSSCLQRALKVAFYVGWIES
jgi:hypothetical protein